MSGLMQHHQSQLEKFGVHFGLDGVKAYDLHAEEEPFSITALGQDFHGGVDGAIAAFGLIKRSVACRCMVAHEHKRSGKQSPADCGQVVDLPKVCFPLKTNVSLLLLQMEGLSIAYNMSFGNIASSMKLRNSAYIVFSLFCL